MRVEESSYSFKTKDDVAIEGFMCRDCPCMPKFRDSSTGTVIMVSDEKTLKAKCDSK